MKIDTEVKITANSRETGNNNNNNNNNLIALLLVQRKGMYVCTIAHVSIVYLFSTHYNNSCYLLKDCVYVFIGVWYYKYKCMYVLAIHLNDSGKL